MNNDEPLDVVFAFLRSFYRVGSVIAVVICYSKTHSALRCIGAAVFSWLSVLFYWIGEHWK